MLKIFLPVTISAFCLATVAMAGTDPSLERQDLMKDTRHGDSRQAENRERGR